MLIGSQKKQINKFPWEVFWAAALLAVVAVVKGYFYGTGNDVEHLPIVLRVIDRSYLTNDFFVNSSSIYNPRFFYTQIIVFLVNFASLPLVYFFLAFLTKFLVALITALVAYDLSGRSKLAGILGCAVVMSVESFYLGGAENIHFDSLISAGLAMPFVLGSLWAAIKQKPLLCSLLAGFGSLIHPLLGLEVGAIGLFTVILARVLISEKGIFCFKLGTSLCILGFFAAILFIPYSRIERINTRQFIDILAYFRHPHHYIPSTFGFKNYLNTSGFFISAIISWYWWFKAKQTSKRSAAVVLVIFVTVVFLCIGGYLFVEIIPTRLWTSAQIFRLLFMVKWLGLILISVAIAQAKPSSLLRLPALLSPATTLLTHFYFLARDRIRKCVLRYLTPPSIYLEQGLVLIATLIILFILNNGIFEKALPFFVSLIVVFCFFVPIKRWLRRLFAVLVVFLFVVYCFFDGRIQIQLPDLPKDQAEITSYVEDKTSEEAIFLTPPGYGFFRIKPKRAIVVDFKSFIFHDQGMLEWQERLFDCYGIVNSSGWAASSEMDGNYRQIRDSKIRELQEKYKISYALLYSETVTALPVIFESGRYKLVFLTSL